MSEESEVLTQLNPLQRFGQDVRRVRLGRSLTQKQLAKAASYSEAYVSRVEAGLMLPRPSVKFARGCDLAFGTNGLFEEQLRRIDEGDHPSWFVPYLHMEKKATHMSHFSASLVTGLVQTEQYACAIFRSSNPRDEDETVRVKAAARVRRREVFERANPPSLWIVLHEASLLTVVGDRATMRGQLTHLLDVSRSPHIDIQILPFSAGVPAQNAMRPFALLGMADGSSVLYSDGPQGGRLYDCAETVALYRDSYDRLRADALGIVESRVRLMSALEEYRQ
ncbi:helix-turn-helix transcriptional regulator [Streptomyces sp. XM4193]|uniref:helix-turn-helix domain-containing protein n=1 Tax=Streptomyces sp. XM4193 TaxID=2929782 RepID=UPI001FFBAD9C|nr:helix-turn-helix transcriptional regulator [Streptomyces sp. XM4193]MCK1795596.1 helix-turn-helix transcriptional regulator [Streptomyces sp. XM4193]